MHKRRIYRRLRTGGLCCHVPARLAPLGLVCGFCSSPRTSCTRASCGQSLAVLPLPSARGYPSLTMSPKRYSHRGLAPQRLAPMLGAQHAIKGTCLRQPLNSNVRLHKAGPWRLQQEVRRVAPRVEQPRGGIAASDLSRSVTCAAAVKTRASGVRLGLESHGQVLAVSGQRFAAKSCGHGSTVGRSVLRACRRWQPR